MASYLTELRRCLKPGRFAFMEYSNLDAYPHRLSGNETNGQEFCPAV